MKTYSLKLHHQSLTNEHEWAYIMVQADDTEDALQVYRTNPSYVSYHSYRVTEVMEYVR